MISILIATRNRQDKLKQCISSILSNDFKNYEIVVVDQSDAQRLIKKSDLSVSKKLKYFRMTEKGKSKALNLAFAKSKGDILAFTDDDCIVANNWLSEIDKSYKKYPKIGGVFGNIYPFGNIGKVRRICPATMSVRKSKIHVNPATVHYIEIGIGNNMSIKRSVFKRIGLFNEMLSPGTFGLGGGEDSEIIFRILKNKIPLLTNPKMVIYHNRWLTGIEEIKLQSKYTAGLVAFQTFSFLSGFRRDMLILFKARLKERLVTPFVNSYWLIRYLFKEIMSFFLQLFGFAQGLFVGIYIYLLKNRETRNF